MEISAFIGLVIISITQMVKMALPRVTGWITILVAFVVGVLVAVFDAHIGLADITIAQGIQSALAAIGGTTLFSKAGGGASGDEVKG